MDGSAGDTLPLPGRPDPELREAPRHVGDYEILGPIARGGMGVVYRARQVKLGRIVALKMILSGRLASDEDVRRFRTEAQAAAQLNHPNIVPVYEVDEFEGHHYFSMELVDGHSLEKLARGKPLAPRRAAAYVKAIALAIQFAHERGILHRDLKPSNVLIDGRDQPRITDFGLAKRMTDRSSLTGGAVVGTPAYMPPEQALGKPATVASDVYALGAILYELLAGRPPFQAETPVATLMQVIDAEPAPPGRESQRAVPRDLETICLACLRKDPGRRYATARDLADDLGRFLEGRPIAARPVSRLERAFKWMSRHPAVMGMLFVASVLGALTAGVVVIGAVGFSWQRQKVQRGAYAGHIAAAARALREGHRDEAYVTLSRCPEPLRGWEWYHLRGRSIDFSLARDRVPGGVRRLAYTADGNWLIVEGGDGALWASPGNGGRYVLLRTGQEGPVAALCPAGHDRMAIVRQDGADVAISVLDVDSGIEVATLREPWPDAAVDPSGALVASCLEASYGPPVSLAVPRPERTVVLDDAGREQMSALPNTPASGLVEVRVPGCAPLLVGRQGPAVVAVALDRQRDVAVVTGADGAWNLWATDTGRRLDGGASKGGVVAAAGFSPRFSMLALGTSLGDVTQRHAPCRDRVRLVVPGVITGWSFDPSGATLAIAASDGSIRLHAVARGGVEKVQAASMPSRLRFSPDGKLLAASQAGGGIEVFDVAARRQRRLLALGAGAHDFAIGSGGEVALFDQESALYDAAGARGRMLVAAGSFADGGAFSPSGRLLALRRANGVRTVVEVEAVPTGLNRCRVEVPLAAGRVVGAAIDPGDARVATLGDDGAVTVWDLGSGLELLTLTEEDSAAGVCRSTLAIAEDPAASPRKVRGLEPLGVLSWDQTGLTSGLISGDGPTYEGSVYRWTNISRDAPSQRR